MLRRFLTLGRLRELTGRAGFVEHDLDTPPNSATLKGLHEVLAAAKSASEKIGARLIIVLLPSPLDALKKTVHAAKYIEPILADLGIETIPFPEAIFDVSRPQFLFSNGYASGHYNDEGYALLAGIVGKYVRSR